MIRAALSGTNWTGKSTTIEIFTRRNPSLHISTFELSELVARCPYPMIQNQTTDGSEWMARELQKILAQPIPTEIQFFGRSPIDILAFTYYAIEKDQTNADEKLIERIIRLVDEFDILFFMSPNIDWPVNVKPYPKPEKIAFALLLNYYMLKVIKKHAINVIELPWNLDKRQQVLQKHLQNDQITLNEK